MFRPSYSNKAMLLAINAIRECNEEIEELFDRYPPEIIPPNSDWQFNGLMDLIFNNKKKKKAAQRAVFNYGVVSSIASHYYDGSASEFEKFLKKALSSGIYFGNRLAKSGKYAKRFGKEFSVGFEWGERYLVGHYPVNDQSDDSDPTNESVNRDTKSSGPTSHFSNKVSDDTLNNEVSTNHWLTISNLYYYIFSKRNLFWCIVLACIIDIFYFQYAGKFFLGYRSTTPIEELSVYAAIILISSILLKIFKISELLKKVKHYIKTIKWLNNKRKEKIIFCVILLVIIIDYYYYGPYRYMATICLDWLDKNELYRARIVDGFVYAIPIAVYSLWSGLYKFTHSNKKDLIIQLLLLLIWIFAASSFYIIILGI